MPRLPNIRQSLKDFIVEYALQNPEWKKRLVKTNEISHAKAVFMVRNELTKESGGVIMLSEVLSELL